jgi:hypothetical protein
LGKLPVCSCKEYSRLLSTSHAAAIIRLTSSHTLFPTARPFSLILFPPSPCKHPNPTIKFKCRTTYR